ncbi:MAG: hypothetical protein MAGBODY4_01535 [Candidatus Marinimicrobia bacterium]|nr:hypothetical protein [Candidatus Neomarinimicrobiota bacterium]
MGVSVHGSHRDAPTSRLYGNIISRAFQLNTSAGRFGIDRAGNMSEIKAAPGGSGHQLAVKVINYDASAGRFEVQIELLRHRCNKPYTQFIRVIKQPQATFFLLTSHNDIVTVLGEIQLELFKDRFRGFFTGRIGNLFNFNGNHISLFGADRYSSPVTVDCQRSSRVDFKCFFYGSVNVGITLCVD